MATMTRMRPLLGPEARRAARAAGSLASGAGDRGPRLQPPVLLATGPLGS
jgi:hypothetical protein